MLIINSIFFLNIVLSYVLYRESRSIILKLKIKLVEVIVKDIISNRLYRVKPSVFSAKYKELIFKEI